MPCYHPKFAYDINSSSPLGAKRVISFRTPAYSSGDRPPSFQVPCGTCVGCRLSQSRDWANRCLIEASYHRSSYFVTLTYADEFVPRGWTVDKFTGECFPNLTLRSRDLQLFLKQVRYRFNQSVRFFACGEYGSHTLRPHYHCLLFGLELSDLQYYGSSPIGQPYFSSVSLQRCWYDADVGSSRGFVLVGKCSWASAAYVARYSLKKKYVSRKEYEKLGLEPEFIRMSRNPGIARRFYDEHPDLMMGTINFPTEDGGKSFPPPHYFRRLLSEDDPVSAQWLSMEYSRNAELAQLAELSLTSLDFYDNLRVKEQSKIRSLSSLERRI
ncbi:replication initiator protein [Dipodfec virus RodF1_52]|uniref:Replication initiator protein n=1 Tax=Dipodfec virus RodF1_52 TaxID=2929301 RepID=A0A976N384_9VIRU|nr:replication initiator protein [Dipodfec virus RodF1_52]